jgi:hypothetical protein
MNLGALGPNGSSGQVDEDEARVDAIRKTDGTPRLEQQGVTAIDSLEPVSSRATMGEGGEDKEARHEAEGAG